MNRLKKGNIITCFDLDDLKVTEDGLINDGYGFIETYDTVSMKWKIKIIKVREAENEPEEEQSSRDDNIEQLEKIREEVYTRYCRYSLRNRNGHMSNKLFDDTCNRCPLNKLYEQENYE